MDASIDAKERTGAGSDPHLLGKHEGFALLTTRIDDLVVGPRPTQPRRSLRSDPVYTMDETKIGSGRCTTGVGPDPYLGGGFKMS
jgi:hypothetical protein